MRKSNISVKSSTMPHGHRVGHTQEYVPTIGILCVRMIMITVLILFAFPISAKEVVQTYYPDGNAFVCINGSNRYTRALYGSFTDWRLETSDRPVFASYKKGECRNIRFVAYVDGRAIPLDSTDYCKASYVDGRRDYILKDKRLYGGQITLSAAADRNREGAVWRIAISNIRRIKIEIIPSNSRRQRFPRSGDIGTGGFPDGFDAMPGERPLQTLSVKLNDNDSVGFFAIDKSSLSSESKDDLSKRYADAVDWSHRLSSSVAFSTPDPYINPIGGAMVMAADGAWDGKVWNHGAVGWRMPLPGWRGAFAGDFLGMPDRQISHFNTYAASQVSGVPVTLPHLMDSVNNLARGAYVWGTPMYSNGYICRQPENNRKFHHYDMNLNFIDELLWHFEFDADTAYMRMMWPVLKSHLAWEKQAWDPDDDGLYDAYCCIWASDALQYNSGAVTHSSAYNYRGNRLAARIAEIIGEDPKPYRDEADRILRALNARLWIPSAGHWAEYQDFMGARRVHPDAALWSIYVPIDCGVGTKDQNYAATRYVDDHIPHILFTVNGKQYFTISTSDWQPYEWSINNVAMAEVMHTALAFWQSGRADEAYDLLKGCVMDYMYTGQSPANFGQVSKFDINKGESYRDFTDATGIASRAFIEGLYGITPDALNGRCIIRPGFPASWTHASIHTPYLDYSFNRKGGKDVYRIRQHFKRPLRIVIRRNIDYGEYRDTVLSADSILEVSLPSAVLPVSSVDLSAFFNANVTDIFKNKYLSPRSPYTTLAIPTQGVGDWCSTKRTANVDDSWLRSHAPEATIAGIPFRTPSVGQNIVFTSLWDNYPDSITIPLHGSASRIYLLMTGSTNAMQSYFENGFVRVEYEDGSNERLSLVNPDNWCPIERDYADDGLAFRLPLPRPYRVSLKTGMASRALARDMAPNDDVFGDMINQNNAAGVGKPSLTIDGGAAEVLSIKLNPKKKLRSLTFGATANDVLIGLMGCNLE